MYLNARQEDLVFGMLGDFGALTARPAVGKLQRFLNDWADDAGYGALELDQKYGGCTHATLKKFCAWYASNPNATLRYSATAIDAGGPMAAAAFLAVPPYQGFSAAELTELQQAFGEWIEAGRTGCGEGPTPGTYPGGDGILPEPGTPGGGGTTATEETIAPLTRKAGLGTFGWFLVILVVGGVGYGVWRYSRRPQLPAHRANVRSHANRWA